MNKAIVAVLLAAVVGAGIYLYTSRPDPQAEPDATGVPPGAEKPEEPPRYYVPVTDAQPSVGPDDALVTIVEFSDFGCVYCARMVDTLNELREQYGDNVRIVWRNMPADMHPNAEAASRLAMEAYSQSGDEVFWQVHDTLFDNIEKGLDDEFLQDVAREFGLDPAQVLDGNAQASVVNEDIELGVKLGLPGTPVYFVNGIEVQGAIPRPMFRSIVEHEIASGTALVESGVPKAEVYATLIKDGQREADPLPDEIEAPDLEYQSK
ncbi:MAG: DsbA family protein [Myxococcota bacterium]